MTIIQIIGLIVICGLGYILGFWAGWKARENPECVEYYNKLFEDFKDET